MKQYYCILLLLFSFSFYAQNETIPVVKKTNISVVSADKMNVVYRGVPNPISIAVNNAKSYTVSGDGVSLQNGKYVLRAGSGTEAKIIVEIENFDGSKIIEEHIFRIKGLPHPTGAINNKCTYENYFEFKKEELKKAEISIDFIDFLFDIKFETISFSIFYKNKEFKVEGNKMNDSAYNFIKKLRKNSIIQIKNIYYPHSPESELIRIYPIIIKLVD